MLQNIKSIKLLSKKQIVNELFRELSIQYATLKLKIKANNVAKSVY